MSSPHVLHGSKESPCNAVGYCVSCHGGLKMCSVCCGAGQSLPTECPGRKMTDREDFLVHNRHLDFRNGQWFDPVSHQTYACVARYRRD